MSEESQDKTHQATPHKLREARRRGQVAKSQELNYAAVLAVAVGVCFGAASGMSERALHLAARLFGELGRTGWSHPELVRWAGGVFADALILLAPLLLGVALAAVVANVAQVGGVFSTEALKPDFTRLNPATGIKRLFSLRLLYEALRSVLKLALLGLVAWLAIRAVLPDLLRLGGSDSRVQGARGLGHVGPLLFKLLLAVLLIALADLVYTRWDFGKKMRMSHRDLSDEHKNREGDPRIRSRLRQLRAEMLKQAQSTRRVPEADVLITNPTHLAIALSYRHGEMPAPKLLAKGSGEVARKMRSMALAHNVPVVENRPLARALYKQASADDYVPESLYPTVARILLWVYAMRRQRAGQA